MADYKLTESIVYVNQTVNNSRQTTHRTSYDLKDKIIELQKLQKLLKQSIIETDVALKSPKINYRQSILQSTYESQKSSFESFCQQFKSLKKQERKPYETMFRKFKEKINQHQEQIRLAIDEPREYQKKLQNIRQVWFQNEQTEEEEWRFLLRGFIGILGAFLCAVMIGSASRFGLINVYISSFYKITTDPHLEMKKNTFVGPLTMACIGLSLKIGLKISNTYGPIKMLVISVIGMSGSVFAASFMNEFVEFILFNNVIYSVFAGMIFLTALRQPHRYFPKYKLIINAFILMGGGIGSVAFGVLNVSCMNPLKEKPLDSGYFAVDRDHIARHFPICWREMSVVLVLVGIAAGVCFYPLVTYNRKEEQIKLQKGEVPDFENSCYTDQQGLKSGVFWILVLLVVSGTFGSNYLTANYKPYAKAEKDPIFKNQDYMLMVQLTAQLCGSFFGVFWSLSIRTIGFKYTYIIACFVQIFVYICFLEVQMNETKLMATVIIHFIVQGGWLVIFSNACLLIFGDIIGESIYSYCWIFFAVVNFLQWFLSLNIPNIAECLKTSIKKELVPQNSFKILIYPSIILTVIAIVVCSLAKLQGRWENSLKLLTFKCEE